MATRHDRSYFYKYLKLERALQVLRDRVFRWSSPASFNDPFDSQSGFVVGDTYPEIAATAVSALVEATYSDLPVVESPISTVVQKLRPIRDVVGRVRLEQIARELSVSLVDDLHTAMQMVNKEAIDLVCKSRVFCVSERNDSMLMWSHYADGHKGLVLQLGCIPDIDNPLCEAQPVVYTEEFLKLPSDFFNVSAIKSTTQRRFGEWLIRLAYAKHKDWAYEREWRVHVPLGILNAPQEGQHSDFLEQDPVFQAAFFGCAMQESEKHEVASLVRREMPHMQLFEAVKSTSTFALSFQPYVRT